MKKTIIFLFAIASMLSTRAQSIEDKNKVDAVVSAFMNSWNSHNFENISDYATKDFYYISPDAEVWASLDSVKTKLTNMHKGGFKNTPLEEKSRTIRFISKDAAIATLIAHLGFYESGKNKRGDYSQIRTMTLVRQDGKWLLAAAQATPFPQPVKPTQN